MIHFACLSGNRSPGRIHGPGASPTARSILLRSCARCRATGTPSSSIACPLIPASSTLLRGERLEESFRQPLDVIRPLAKGRDQRGRLCDRGDLPGTSPPSLAPADRRSSRRPGDRRMGPAPHLRRDETPGLPGAGAASLELEIEFSDLVEEQGAFARPLGIAMVPTWRR